MPLTLKSLKKKQLWFIKIVGFLFFLFLFPFKRPDSQPRCDARQKSTRFMEETPSLLKPDYLQIMSFAACRDLCILCTSITNEDSSWGAKQGSGDSLKKICIYILRVYVIWYVSEIRIWLVHIPPQTLFHHAAGEGDCSGVAAMLKRKHNNIHRCFKHR